MLHHLARALYEESAKQIRHETGKDPKQTEIVAQRTEPGTIPFAVSFQMSTFGPYGEIVYTITVVESRAG